MRHASLIRACAVAAIISLVHGASFAQEAACGSLANSYGPYDYRTGKDKLPIVDNNHFTPKVEALISGQSGYLGGDIDYTLRAYPNHHRALLAMMRYGERTHVDKPPDAQYTVACYFDRALRFRPDDTVARMLYVTYLNKHQRTADANAQMADVVRRAGDDGFTHYNAGLVYVEMKNWPLALQEAHRAIALGFTRPELPDQLRAAGKWVEPTAAPASAASAALADAAPAASAAAAASAP